MNATYFQLSKRCTLTGHIVKAKAYENLSQQIYNEIQEWLKPFHSSWDYQVVGDANNSLVAQLQTLFKPNPVMLRTLVIDASMGRPLKNIRELNEKKNLTVSIDMPAGLNPETGEGDVVLRADMTLCLGIIAPGLFKNQGPANCGQIRWIEMPLCDSITSVGNPDSAIFCIAEAKALLSPRPVISNKYTFGRILILAGSAQYNGAPFLAAEGAMRAGAGLTTLILPQHARKRPGPMSLIVREMKDADCFEDAHLPKIADDIEKADAILFGPGISLDASTAILLHLLQIEKTLVLDADALTLLSRNPNYMDDCKAKVILTPHAGEMARLVNAFIPELKDAPSEEQGAALAKRLNCVLVQKGHRTRVFDGVSGLSCIILSGGPALATAGTGDVLAGIITTFAAQMPAYRAAQLGAFIHGLTADLSPLPARSLIADDLPALIPAAFRKCGE